MCCWRGRFLRTLANSSFSVSTTILASGISNPCEKDCPIMLTAPVTIRSACTIRDSISKSRNVLAILLCRSLELAKIKTVACRLIHRSTSPFKTGIWPKNSWTALVVISVSWSNLSRPIPFWNIDKKIWGWLIGGFLSLTDHCLTKRCSLTGRQSN